jgi:hypothetical protein
MAVKKKDRRVPDHFAELGYSTDMGDCPDAPI